MMAMWSKVVPILIDGDNAKAPQHYPWTMLGDSRRGSPAGLIWQDEMREDDAQASLTHCIAGRRALDPKINNAWCGKRSQ